MPDPHRSASPIRVARAAPGNREAGGEFGALATATLLSLLGRQLPPLVALPGLAVTRAKVIEAYQVVRHSLAPPALMKARHQSAPLA